MGDMANQFGVGIKRTIITKKIRIMKKRLTSNNGLKKGLGLFVL